MHGLQFHKHGRWHDVTPAPDGITVNVGDQCQVGRWWIGVWGAAALRLRSVEEDGAAVARQYCPSWWLRLRARPPPCEPALPRHAHLLSPPRCLTTTAAAITITTTTTTGAE